MEETKSYTIDILNILPSEVSCFIQAPDIEDSAVLELMLPSAFEYYKEIKLTDSNKKKLIERISSQNIEEDFQSIEIRHHDKLLFKGYDGMEYGTISKSINLPDWFVEKYIDTDMCIVSKEW